MRIWYIKIFILLIFILLVNNFSFWTDRKFDWLTIITRQERWADDNILFSDNDVYKKILEKEQEYKTYLDHLKEEDLWSYVKEKQKSFIESKKIDYLNTNFYDEVKFDNEIFVLNWVDLWRPIKYKFEKDRIIIHHTANDYSKISNMEETKEFLRNIYKFHAFTRWWWDIWYNFIIDKDWNIYEWRKWWEWVVWAHSKRNNTLSIWISLIWNFEIQKPTDEQLKSLILLTRSFVDKYKIDPYKKVSYHMDSDHEPYLKDSINNSIVWHKDSWYTSCPWKNLYVLLPKIIEYVSNQKLVISDFFWNQVVWNNPIKFSTWNSEIAKQDLNKKSYNQSISKIYMLKDNNFQINITPKILINQNLQCSSDNFNISINKCYFKKKELIIDFSRIKQLASWITKFKIVDNNSILNVKTKLIWIDEIEKLIENLKNNYVVQNWIKYASNKTKKINYKIWINEAKQLMSNKLKVLLYDLSMNFDKWDIVCNWNCNLDLDWLEFENLSWVSVLQTNWKIKLLIWDSNFEWNKLIIQSKNYLEILNYDRKSYAWKNWNIFKWDLIFQKDEIKKLDWNYIKKIILINEISLIDYLYWIAESNDNEPIEKMKLMALLSKNYILFYVNKKNSHPSIPINASYNSIDDPRLFQKYVWAWYLNTSTKRKQIVDDTYDKIILYDWYLPILPYFNCSAWFTFSWFDKYWWIDTPYLESKLDYWKCDKFNWHWVGLSWYWATIMANKWYNFTKILKYYYWDSMKIYDIWKN